MANCKINHLTYHADDNMYTISIDDEKVSGHRARAGLNVMRVVPLLIEMTPMIKALLNHRDIMTEEIEKDDGFFLRNKDGSPLPDRGLTSAVQNTCKSICGLELGPLDFRHLRATYFFRSVEKDTLLSPEARAQLYAEYAAATGQTSDMFLNNYVFRNLNDEAHVAISITKRANQYLDDLME